MRADRIIASAGTVFAISAATGDIPSGGQDGLYSSDTRFLSKFEIRWAGRPLEAVGVDRFYPSLVSFYDASPFQPNATLPAVSLVRDRYVERALHEDVHLRNDGREPVDGRLEIAFDCDFADVFEVRGGQPRRAREVEVTTGDASGLRFRYRSGDFRRETWISLSRPAATAEKVARYDLRLGPHERWSLCVDVRPGLGDPAESADCVRSLLSSPFDPYRRRASVPTPKRRPLASEGGGLRLPALETSLEGLKAVYEQTFADLRTLSLEIFPRQPILAAGLPWYMTLFGRDSILAATETKLLGPRLLEGTLRTLARLQATTTDPFTDAEPGKIPHELRHGQLAVEGQIPFECYYGSVDATPLFVRLLAEAYEWTGSRALLNDLLPAAERAMAWIDAACERGHGFLAYRAAREATGLRNQGWKDSEDAIAFADGRLAEPPIALAEVQGYVYAARRAMARIYEALDRPDRARELEASATRLQRAFDRAFWLSKAEYFALALDGDGTPVDAIASNPGHGLWSGIVEKEKAARLVRRLMAPDLFSGWGIRTLSTEMDRYHPLSYHNGSVWPHDTALIARGMARYGFHAEARELALALLDAATAFTPNRLPELFSGFSRRPPASPVPYPGANSPQAWASGAIVYGLETLLGLAVEEDRIVATAPADGIALSLADVRFRGAERSVRIGRARSIAG